MMFVLAAMALALGANDSTPSATLAWLAAMTASPEMSRIEQQIADDTNISLERSNGSVSKRSWKNAVKISDCVADIATEVATSERGATSTLRQSAKFNLSQIRWIDRSHGASFKQETIFLVLSSEPGGPKPVRNVDSTTGCVKLITYRFPICPPLLPTERPRTSNGYNRCAQHGDIAASRR